MNDMLYWIWLSLATTAGGTSFSKLIAKYSDPCEIYLAERDALVSLLGSRSKDISALCDKNLDAAKEVLDFCQKKGVGLLAYSDRGYPELLRKIPNPPPLLYYRGTLPDFKNECAIAVVGTRRLDSYGRKNAYSVTKDLARAGALIVSGMATGIDGVAQAAALSESARTVAVLGSGIDVCYPKEHITLARAIVKCGAVITEFPPKTPPNKQNFPIRNRIISGISQGVFVVEGTERSGSLITARRAREQERRIYALPGNVGNKNSEGTNLLIKSGALAVTGAADIISDIEKLYPGSLDAQRLSGDCSDIDEVLSAYAVSALTADDAVFKAKRSKAKSEAPTVKETVKSDVAPEINEKEIAGISRDALALYKRIPLDGGCAIEALVCDEFPLRRVMQLLLKLEIGQFVKLLPGERVRRNFH